MSKKIKLWLLVIFIFQIFVAMGFELAHDEAYYWLYSKNLDWGFFDHPPFVGFVINLFSFLPKSEFSVRIGFIILQFATLFLLLNLTSLSSTAVWLYFSFPLASFAGLLALPDMCLLFMTACYCFALKNYLENESSKSIILLAITIPLVLYAKYHGILLIFFTLVAVPSLFKKRSFYFIFAISLLLFLPHFLWQYQHDFSTLRYHFLERPRSEFSIKRVLEYVGTQIGLAGFLIGPVIWKMVFSRKTTTAFERAMKTISLGTILFFLISTFSKKFEANWTIFLTIPLIYLSAQDHIWSQKSIRRLLFFSLSFVLLSRLLLVIPPRWTNIKRLHEFNGWKAWSEKIEKECGGEMILANTYQVASKLSFYLDKEISSFNYQSRKNQFDYWKFEERIPTEKVCYLTNKAQFGGVLLLTPEGKSLHLIKNMSLRELWTLKYDLR
jgi:hypothetical protein